MKKFSFVLILCFLTLSCSSNKTPPNIILLPSQLALDQTTNRLFVVDSANNGLSLIDVTNNSIVTGAPLLTNNSTIRLPQLPQDIAVANLGNGVTRIFIIGNGPPPTNQITVLDFDSTSGLQVAPVSPIIVGANTAADQSDLLNGLALDETSGTLFVSNATDSLVRAYNISNGSEKTGSPITVQSTPAKMGFDASINRLFVSSLGGTTISILDTQDLTLPIATFDVGLETNSVAVATNSNGTVLFTVSPLENEIRVFNFNVTTPSLTTQIGSPIIPPPPGSAASSTDVLTGAATQVASAPLVDGRIAGLITESTGDLGFVDVAIDLSTFTGGNVTVINALGASGIDILKDASGNGTTAYFAAPGGSAVSFVNIITNQFVGQLL
jgi:WD40 repeat protein